MLILNYNFRMSTIQQLTLKDFLEILREYPVDKEKFYHLSDRVKNY